MIGWIFSIFLYLGTIIYGIYLDSINYPANRAATSKNYVIWLFIFLCFGYMVGADWRNYELAYLEGFGLIRFLSEPISWVIFEYVPNVIPDFWLFSGLAKCLYLYTVIRLAKRITTKWISTVAILIPGVLAFMLIQNPMRYMFSLTIVNVSLIYLYDFMKSGGKRIKDIVMVIVLAVISALCHNSCFIFIILLPLSLLSTKIANLKKTILFFVYMVLTVFTSNISYLAFLKESVISIAQDFITMPDYSSYEIESNDAIFSIGNILRIVFFIFVLRTKDSVVNKYDNGKIIYGLTLIYFFFSRILILIPTGFRLALPFVIFYTIYIVYLLNSKLAFYGKIIVIYSLLSFTTQLWNSFDLIPYSNSIPYILTGHKPYQERDYYNIDEYKSRTGNYIYLNVHEQ